MGVGQPPTRPVRYPLDENSKGDRHMRFSAPLKKFLSMMAAAAGALINATSGASAGPSVQINLVSDIPGLAAIQDSNLRNPWGVSHGAATPFWVSDQGANFSTLYTVTAAGITKNALTVSIPTTASGPQGPTGQVSNVGGS